MPVFYSPIPQNLRMGLASVGGSVFTNNRTGDFSSDYNKDQDDKTGRPVACYNIGSTVCCIMPVSNIFGGFVLGKYLIYFWRVCIFRKAFV